MTFGSITSGALAAFALASGLCATGHAQSGAPSTQKNEGAQIAPAPAQSVAQEMGGDDALSSIQRSVKFLLGAQNKDGAWGSGTCESVLELEFSVESFYAWQMGGQALACMALMVVDETPERRAALERAVHWLCESRLPKRGSDWDIDYNWTSLYGFIALVQAAQDPRFQSPEWRQRIDERARAFYALLEKNQEPEGGWGYYEGPVISPRPTWSTSFSTACVIPALIDARAMGWPIDPKVIDRAVKYIARCALPNGAYEYDLNVIPRINGGEHINDVKGSLGRIQVCNWALRRAGVPTVTDEKIKAGLEEFFADHKFLDFARMRPIPHEGYYKNAGYFYFFGHYHAAMAINELPVAEREALHARLRPHLAKVQWADGSSMDFQGSSYLQIASTSFSLMALEAGLHPERFRHPSEHAGASKPR